MGVYRKQRIAVGSGSWTAIAPPITCYALILRNAGPAEILLRTDESDPDTEDQIEAGLQEIIRSPNWFLAGQRICVVKAKDGSSTVVLTFSG
jgi:hypothetical protein